MRRRKYIKENESKNFDFDLFYKKMNKTNMYARSSRFYHLI